MAVLIFIDGVMRREDNIPIPEGMRLYKHLAERERVLLIGKDRVDIDRWMKQNNIASKLDDIIDFDPGYELDEISKKRRQIDYVRSKGPVEYVITDDIELSRNLIEFGISTFLFLHPKYFSHKFRPDRPAGVTAWNNIIDELDKQQKLYEDDKRL